MLKKLLKRLLGGPKPFPTESEAQRKARELLGENTVKIQAFLAAYSWLKKELL